MIDVWNFKSLPEEQKTREFFRAADYLLPIHEKTFVMGILNVTPDSFSDGGNYYCPAKAVHHALEMAEAGADMIDIGGESTRPGHTPVHAKEETRRIIPVISALRKQLNIPVSVDTSKASVASAAMESGASIINDIWGLRKDPDIAEVAQQSGAGLIMMFNALDEDLVKKSGDIVFDAMEYLAISIRIAREAGVKDEQIMIDPGIGFGVNTQESLALIRGLPSFRELGFPVIIGPSRKRFIGAVLNAPIERRLTGTIAACCSGVCLGANAVRVHEVAEVVSAMKMRDAIYGIHGGEEND